METTSETMSDINQWILVCNDSMRAGGIAEIYDCFSSKLKGIYVAKLLIRKDSNDIVNKMTIDLQIKLGKLGIMPEIVDNGIAPPVQDDPTTFVRRFFVMKKYMINGADYIVKLKQCAKLIPIQISSKIWKYYNSVFDLYRRLATNGVCSFDVRNKNIVLNYDYKTLDITDIRVIDIDYAIAKVYKLPNSTQTKSAPMTADCMSNKVLIQSFVAMVLMHYTTDGCKYSTKYSTYDCYRNIIQKINFDYLLDLRFDLIEESAEYKTGTYIGIFYCYYNMTNLEEFLAAPNPVELFQSAFDAIVIEFPFIKDVPKNGK